MMESGISSCLDRVVKLCLNECAAVPSGSPNFLRKFSDHPLPGSFAFDMTNLSM